MNSMRITLRLLCLACLPFTLACNNNSDTGTTNTINKSSGRKETGIAERSFGAYENSPVTEYTLTNPAGMQVRILNDGGTVTKIIVPDRHRKMGDVVLGFESFDGYQQKKDPYFGSLVGRYANRIAQAKFTLDGKIYTLAANNNGNSLHGGNKGFDKVLWTAEKLNDSSLKLTYLSKDGEEGYPGTLNAKVTYNVGFEN